MSISNFFNKTNADYNAATEFFISPELHITESSNGDYSLAIDTGYDDLNRKVSRLNLEGSEVSIKTKTSYVDYQELYDTLSIPDKEQVFPSIYGLSNQDVKTSDSSQGLPKTPAKPKQQVLNKIKSQKDANELDSKKASTESKSSLPDNALLAEDLPESIRLKQDQIIEKGVYYKPLKVISTLVVQDDNETKEQQIATSYYLAPVGFIDGSYLPLSSAQCAHIVETSWSDAYIEAMNGGETVATAPSNPSGHNQKAKKGTSPFIKAPIIVALSLTAAFASLYGFNQYQQNNNPLTLAASTGTVDTYMNAKGSNTSEYTQRQLEATKAALSSMGIDVSATADIGCLIE